MYYILINIVINCYIFTYLHTYILTYLHTFESAFISSERKYMMKYVDIILDEELYGYAIRMGCKTYLDFAMFLRARESILAL